MQNKPFKDWGTSSVFFLLKERPISKTVTVTVKGVAIKSQAADDWSEQASELPFDLDNVVDPGEPGNYTMTFTFATAGTGTKPEVTLGAKE